MDMYEKNEAFREYVDKYVKKEEIDVATALTHKVVKEYRDYIVDRGESEIGLRNMWSGSAGEPHENVIGD